MYNSPSRSVFNGVAAFSISSDLIMKIKKGVNVQGLHISMQKVMKVVELVYKKYGQESVITSGMDGTHSAGSFHYFGMALDYRTRFFENDFESVKVAQEIAGILGDNYTVIFEKTHIHIQCNNGIY